jgi:hypothetical protein
MYLQISCHAAPRRGNASDPVWVCLSSAWPTSSNPIAFCCDLATGFRAAQGLLFSYADFRCADVRLSNSKHDTITGGHRATTALNSPERRYFVPRRQPGWRKRQYNRRTRSRSNGKAPGGVDISMAWSRRPRADHRRMTDAEVLDLLSGLRRCGCQRRPADHPFVWATSSSSSPI